MRDDEGEAEVGETDRDGCDDPPREGPSEEDGGMPDEVAAPVVDNTLLSQLLEEVATGNRNDFNRLYRVTSGRLFAIALRMTRQRELAEEVLQDTYLKVWHKARLFDREQGSAMGWLITVLRRTALDRLRLGSTNLSTVELQYETLELEDVRETLHRGMAEDVRDCIQRLEERYRRVILLAFFHGLTHEELASHLGVPLGTAKSWVRRGLSRLKSCLDDKL